MHPVFLSMGGVRDTALASQVKAALPDGLVYMYTRNGEEGTSFRREIEAEVQSCKLFVVFWSDDYLASEHAKLELATFKRSAESLDSGRELLVVQTSRKSPNIQKRWKNPINGKEEFTLGRWRLDRAVAPDRDSIGIAEIMKRKLDSLGFSSAIIVQRPDIQSSIAAALDAGEFYKKEFVFISGSEGDGRRTAIKTYMEGSKHLLPRFIPFDSVEGPEDVLERLLEYSGEPLSKQVEVIKSVNEGVLNPIKEFRKIIHQFRTTRNYLVLIMDRYSGVDPSVGIPLWVSQAVEPFKRGHSPLIFFVTSNPVTDELLRHYPNAGRARIPGLDEIQMHELVFNLSHVDPYPSRWTAENRNLVAQISGSSPSLCQKVMKLTANEPNLQYLERIARTEEEKFSASLSGLLGYIVEKFKDSIPDLIAMQVVEKLGIVEKSTLDEIMEMRQIGSYDLYGLLQYGVFEQLSDSLLRIPPLLQRRLGFVLWGVSRDIELDSVLQEFGARQVTLDDGYGIVYMSNKAAASLRSLDETPAQVEPFITLSMLFKAGVEQYAQEGYEVAYSILRRAMGRLQRAPVYVDETTCIEIARYFGLAAARIRKNADVDTARELLKTRFLGSKKEKQALAMAAFLRGFMLRISGEHKDAIAEFEEADSILKNVTHAARQHGAVLTEISRAYLRLAPPRLDAAVRAAERAYERQDALHNLNSLVRAKIYRFAVSANDSGQLREITRLLESLKKISVRAGREFHLVRSADLDLVLALQQCKASGLPLDLEKSIRLAEQAMVIRRSDQNQLYLWKLKSLHQLTDFSRDVVAEAQAIYSSENAIPSFRRISAAKALIMCYAKSDSGRASQILAECRELGARQRGFFKKWIERKVLFEPDLVLSLEWL